MTFREINKGYNVYMLHKGEDELKAEIGKVVVSTQPRFPQMYNGGAMSGMVMDVTISANGANKTYVVPVDSCVVNAGNIVISTDKDGILREVEAMEAESDDVLNSVEKHKKRKEECEKIKTEWNPQIAEKKEQEERIKSVETEVKGLSTMLKDLIKELKGG